MVRTLLSKKRARLQKMNAQYKTARSGQNFARYQRSDNQVMWSTRCHRPTGNYSSHSETVLRLDDYINLPARR
jgi:hypothetical protein